MTLIVNLFGPPSAGKTTVALGLLYKLKRAGISCEYAPEYAKELVWRDDRARLEDQYGILDEQSFRLITYMNKVDVIVTDGPLLLAAYYNRKYFPDNDPDLFDKIAVTRHSSMPNINFFVERLHPYEARGRYQTEEEAVFIQDDLKAFLNRNKVPYTLTKNTDNHIDSLVLITKMEI